jgi:hypothetical protein
VDQNPLVSDRIVTGAKFLAGLQETIPVRIAFWLKGSEAVEANLYVASDKVTGKNIDIAYGEVLRVTNSMHDPWLNPWRVKLIGSKHPLAQAALDVLRRYPDRRPLGVERDIFGGVSVDWVYIYPPLSPAQPS